MSLHNDAALNYLAGAGTALALMAEAGAPEEQVKAVAEEMNVCFEQMDESDKERMIQAYGKLPEQN